MARGPHIKEEEVRLAKELRSQKLKLHEIARKLSRSVATVCKMLKMPEQVTPADGL